MAESAVKITKGRNTLKWLLLFTPSIFIAAVVVYPFIQLLYSNANFDFASQITGSSPVAQLTRKAIQNSIVQGAVSALLSFVAGLPVGLFLGRHTFRLKRMVNSIVIIPFFLPSILVVFAFISGFGSNSSMAHILPFTESASSGFTGIIAVNTFFNAPLVALFTMTAVEQSDVALNEAAMTLGAADVRRFRTVWGKDALLAASGAALLAFTYSFAGFAAPLIIGGPGYFTLDAWIYFMVKTLNNLQAAMVLALIEALILVLPALSYIIFSSRQRRVTGSQLRLPVQDQRKNGYFYAGAAYTFFWVVVELYLLSSVFAASLENSSGQWWHFANYIQLFGGRTTSAIGISAASSILNTVFYGTMTSLLVVTLGLMWITGRRRLNYKNRFASEPLQYVPLIISSIIMAFSVSVVFGIITPESLIWVLIILAQTSVAIPVVLRVIDSGFSSISHTYTEAALTLRGNPFFEVEMPMARSTFASALMFAFAISLGEFSATNFLATTNYVPLTVEMYLLRGVRLFGASFAAASLLLIISIVSFYFIQRLGERFIGFR
ncbi:MAG TPA: ABC transporter permease subunit [Thermoplasmataceae archaeon]|nr:ABC transporter permease subunit [Thermoplasmataceae archaeon]